MLGLNGITFKDDKTGKVIEVTFKGNKIGQITSDCKITSDEYVTCHLMADKIRSDAVISAALKVK